MINRPLIDNLSVPEELLFFVRGPDPNARRAPACIAWSLETAAMSEGWPAGRSLGSERDLMRRFGVSREVLREAIRVVKARGSMRMLRGRNGGLHLVRPRSVREFRRQAASR